MESESDTHREQLYDKAAEFKQLDHLATIDSVPVRLSSSRFKMTENKASRVIFIGVPPSANSHYSKLILDNRQHSVR